MEMSQTKEGDLDTGNKSVLPEPVSLSTKSKSSTDEDDPLLENWGVVTIEDEEDERKRLEGAEELVCSRCPSKEVGTFRSRQKFMLHIQRHTFGDIFNCTKCQRPFETFNACLAHEIREHELMLTYKTSNPLIQKAKRHAERKMRRQQQQNLEAGGASNPEEISPSDSEEEIIIPSTSVSPYRGPKVTHILQCYEIHLNHSDRRENVKTEISRIAMNAHKRNIRMKRDKNRLGRFFNPNNQEAPAEPKRKKKVFYEYITLTSSSDSDYYGISDVDGLDLEGGIMTRSRIRNLRMSSCPSGKKAKKFSSGLSTRKCHKCSYTWKTEDDLRLHRDRMHANLTLEDLMETPSENSSVADAGSKPTHKSASSASSTSDQKRKPKTSAKKSPSKKRMIIDSSSSDSDREKSLQKDRTRKKRLQQRKAKKKLPADNSKKSNLKVCNVGLHRLSLEEIASYQKKDQSDLNLN